jgi:hypothetical protein
LIGIDLFDPRANGSEPLDLDPTARERLAARAAAGGADGEVRAAALRRRRAITRSRPRFRVRLGREASSRCGGSNWGLWEGRGRPWTAAGGERRRGTSGIVVRAWGRPERGKRTAASVLTTRGNFWSAWVSTRSSEAAVRQAPEPSGNGGGSGSGVRVLRGRKTAAAAWRLGHGGGGLSRGAAGCLDVRARGPARCGGAHRPDSNSSSSLARGGERQA